MSARLAAPHSRTPRSAANHRPCFIRISSLSRASPVGRRPLIWRRQKPCSNLPEGSADYLKRDRSQVESVARPRSCPSVAPGPGSLARSRVDDDRRARSYTTCADAAATLLRLNRRKGPGDRGMEEEESRPFGLKWRLICWNRLRIWVGLRDPGVAQPCQPWGDVLEVNRDALERERCALEQLLVVSCPDNVGDRVRGREFSHLVDGDRVTLLERRQVFESSRAVRSRIEVDSPHLPGEAKCVVSDQVWRRGVERLENVGVTHHEQLGTLNSSAEPCHAPGFEQRNIGPQNRLRRSFQRPDEGAHLKSVAVLKSLFKGATGHLNRGQRSRGRIRAGGLRDGGRRGPVRHHDYCESNRIRVAHRVGSSAGRRSSFHGFVRNSVPRASPVRGPDLEALETV